MGAARAEEEPPYPSTPQGSPSPLPNPFLAAAQARLEPAELRAREGGSFATRLLSEGDVNVGQHVMWGCRLLREVGVRRHISRLVFLRFQRAFRR